MPKIVVYNQPRTKQRNIIPTTMTMRWANVLGPHALWGLQDTILDQIGVILEARCGSSPPSPEALINQMALRASAEYQLYANPAINCHLVLTESDFWQSRENPARVREIYIPVVCQPS
jgi:hypothetical protein